METKTVPSLGQEELEYGEELTLEGIDKRIGELHGEYAIIKAELADNSFRTRFSRRIKGYDEYRRKRALELKGLEIEDLLRERPGEYPLMDLQFEVDELTGQQGFGWSYEYMVGDDVFRPGFWAENRWGITVQAEAAGYQPTLEILPEFIKTNEGKDTTRHVVHLPEGYEIPVGPIYVKDDYVPASEKEVESATQQALRIAKAAGIKGNLDQLATDAQRLMPPEGKYTPRYFRWKPVLPKKSASIAIDFGKIRPRDLAIREENAPIYGDTVVPKRPF